MFEMFDCCKRYLPFLLQFDEAVGALPDPNWPVSQQLEHAVTIIKRNVKLVMDSKAEAAVFKRVSKNRTEIEWINCERF